jgi:transcriptional regulator with XRE-family HTH domain
MFFIKKNFIIAFMCNKEKRTENEIIKDLGQRLKYLREQKGVSLNIFAYENDLTTATVSRIENGLVDTKFSTLVKYAKGLEIPLEEIIQLLDINYNNDDF